MEINKMRNSNLFLYSFVFIFLFSFMSSAQELLTNGGFEDAANFEANWDPYGEAGGSIVLDGTQARTGSNSVKCTAATGGGGWIGIGQDIALETNTDYVATFYIKGDNINWGGDTNDNKGYTGVSDPGLGTDELNTDCPGGHEDGELLFGCGDLSDWTEVVYYFNSASNTEDEYWLGCYTNTGAVFNIDDISIIKASSSALEDYAVTVPVNYSLNQNYPNPFNPNTTISFSIPKDDDVNLFIYDVSGRTVNTLVNDKMSSGAHTATWNGTDDTGKIVPSGVYFYKLQTGTFSDTRRMMFLK